MRDALMCVRRFRTFNVVDVFNREILSIEVDSGLPAARVIRVLERIIAWRGYPANYAWIMVRSLFPLHWQNGLSKIRLHWNLLSRERRHKIRLSKVQSRLS